MAVKSIGRLNESTLHRTLKEIYCETEGDLETNVEGFIVDIKQNDTIIEIQTGNFSQLKKKLDVLLLEHKVVIVFPLAKDKWLVRLSEEGEVRSKRLSPKHCNFADAFSELLYIHEYLLHPNIAIEILLVAEEEIRVEDGLGSWKRKGVSIVDHRLLDIDSRLRLENRDDYLTFIPEQVKGLFTNKDLANIGEYSIKIAQKITYTLRKMGILEVRNKEGNTNYFQVKEVD